MSAKAESAKLQFMVWAPWALGSGLLGSGLPGLCALGKTCWAPEFTGLQRLLGSLGSQTKIYSQSLKP